MSALTPMQRRNRKVAAVVVAATFAMIGVAYAAVPLYAAFCRATGFAGTPQVAQAAAGVRGKRILRVRFNANVAPGLDWTFAPETDKADVRTGATTTVFFKFHNQSDQPTVARAVYNVTPELAGAWFDKLSCFCFTEQRLGPHESAELPVVFFLDPRLEQDRDMDETREITLSYTLFAAPGGTQPVAAAPAASGKKL